MTQPYPSALVIASLDSVSCDNNVLYRLVRPLADGSGVESTDRLVNVVPHRRTYCFERKEQVDDFRVEILRRPLVIQPVLHFGRGIGPSCGACYNDEPWVVMINQTHPKILGRLQMGLDLARSAVAKGQSVEIKFRFGKLIERAYREHLQQKEFCEAESQTGFRKMVSRALLPLRFIEWDHGDLTLRSHGLAAKLKTGTPLMLELNNLDMNWEFEDVGMQDMVWSQLQPGVKFPRPHLASVSEDEIRTMLSGWTINTVTPLEAIGESMPVHSYSYAQAGRLYASFRKVRRARGADPHHHAPQGAKEVDSSQESWRHSENERTLPEDWNPQGAEAAPEHWNLQGAEAVPEIHMAEAMHNQWSPQGAQTNWRPSKAEAAPLNYLEISDRDHDQHLYEQADLTLPHDRGPGKTWDHGNDKLNGGLSHYDRYGHMIPQVRIQEQGQNSFPLLHLKKQDSDRSSRSTNADSGYCAGLDDGVQRSREGSYDLNDHMTHTKGRTEPEREHRSGSRDNLHISSSHNAPSLINDHRVLGGVENPAFSEIETKDFDNIDHALQLRGNLAKNNPSTVVAPPRRSHKNKSLPPPSQITESFI